MAKNYKQRSPQSAAEAALSGPPLQCRRVSVTVGRRAAASNGVRLLGTPSLGRRPPAAAGGPCDSWTPGYQWPAEVTAAGALRRGRGECRGPVRPPGPDAGRPGRARTQTVHAAAA
jgi:hypothetical protein